MLGSDIYLYQETLYRSESCKRKLRRTSPCGPPGMATQVRSTSRRRYSCSAIACRSTWLFPPFYLSFIIGMPNRSCIHWPMFCMHLPLYAEMQKPNCAEKKTQCLSCFTKHSRDILTKSPVMDGTIEKKTHSD